MKYDQIRAFEKHLEASAPKHFSHLYLILSKEDSERKLVVENLTHHLLSGMLHPDLCLSTFDGEKCSTEDLLNEVNTVSFLTSRKVILILQGEKLKKAATDALQDYFSTPHPSHYLVITASTINRNTHFYKKAEKEGVVLDLPEAKPWEKEKRYSEWLCQQASHLGKTLSFQSSQYLVKQVGTDPLLLQQELNKLACYIGDRREMTIEDIGTICISINMETIWQLGEALFRRDVALALRIMHSQLASGVPFLVLLRQIRNQFQTEFQICSILSNGGSTDNVVAEFPYMRGAILERHLQMAQKYGMAGFKEAMIAIDASDTLAKNSLIDTTLLAERLVLQLTTQFMQPMTQGTLS